MNRLGGYLALFLGSLLCSSSVFARGSLLTWPHLGNTIPGAAAEACTLDVVLVTFLDANRPNSIYDAYDRPYGEDEDRQLAAASYRRRDFLRLLAGGYAEGGHPAPFVDDTVTVANGHRLPAVFGSVRAYFDQMSNGAFQLHVRIVNPPAAGSGDFPRWIELPNTKQHYAESTTRNEFWNAAYDATLDSLALPDPAWRTGISLPHQDSTATYPYTRLLRRKILFLYSGPFFDNTSSQLHPRVDVVTREDPTPDPLRPNVQRVGYRYVMSERQGFSNNAHGIDEFAGIGMHAHEIGHLLGLNHGEGNWTDPVNRYGNPRTSNPPNEVRRGANQLGWTLMQGGGGQGPVMRGRDYNPNGYWQAYSSCPNPINPFYLWDLGWLARPGDLASSRARPLTEIRVPHDEYPIAPGTTHYIDLGDVEFLLNRRTLEPFGGRYVLFYDYATRNDAEQGLMVWRRAFGREYPILIVADERRYRDARDQDQNPNIDQYYDMLSDPFAAGRIEAPTGYDQFDQANVDSVHSLTAGEGLRQATTGFGANPDRHTFDLALTDIHYDGDNILVDVTFAPPQPPDLTAEVQAGQGQVTLRWAASDDSTVTYQYRYDGVDPIDLDPPYSNSIEVPITGLTDDTYRFEVTAVNGLGTATATLTATPQALGESAVDFAEDVTPAEDDTPAVASYTVTGLGDTPTWRLDGDDDTENTFELRGTGPTRTLYFQQPPDFEPLFATREDSVYTMTLRAHADPVTVTQQVAVTLRNVEEAGGVSLSSLAPERGQELTAEVADVDGVLPATTVWTWEAAGEAVHTDSGGDTSRYTPSLSDVGRELQVRVAYRDRQGPNKRAVSAITAAVVGPELVGPESLTFVEHGTFVDEAGEEVEPTYTVSGVDGTATWSLAGLDQAAFDLAAASGGASLSFSETELPNFEAPTDTDLGGPNTYHVTVVATLTDGASEPEEDPFANLFAAFQSVSDESSAKRRLYARSGHHAGRRPARPTDSL